MVRELTSLRVKKPVLVLVFGSMCLVLAGCTPKRVVNNEILTGNNPNSTQQNHPPSEPPSDGLPKVRQEIPAAKGDFGTQAVNLAKQQLGKMYQWGGQGPDRFDCSGLVYYVYGNLGVPMPRVSSQQAEVGQGITRSQLQPGDMLCFATNGSQIDHVGIYLGGTKFIHAPRKGMPVRTDSLNNGWWKQKYRGARRIRN